MCVYSASVSMLVAASFHMILTPPYTRTYKMMRAIAMNTTSSINMMATSKIAYEEPKIMKSI